MVNPEPADQTEAADTTIKKNDEVEPDPDSYGEIIADNSGTTQIIIDGETKVIQKTNPEPQDEYPEQ